MCVRYGADVNARNTRGDTALHHAVWGGNAFIRDFLLGQAADDTLRNHQGHTCYHGVEGKMRDSALSSEA
jgi:ankyrin repeat protein